MLPGNDFAHLYADNQLTKSVYLAQQLTDGPEDTSQFDNTAGMLFSRVGVDVSVGITFRTRLVVIFR